MADLYYNISCIILCGGSPPYPPLRGPFAGGVGLPPAKANVNKRNEVSKMPVNKIRLEICGCSYVISTTDSEQYTLSLAEKLDHNMNEIMVQNPSASVTAAAVLSALDYLDELEKSSASADNMRGQIKDYLEDAANAKLEAEEAKREIERLRREIGYLKGQG